ncbi:PTS glucose transporter subunit IIA, partial [Xanthomonas citri pv. citri]
AIAASFFTAMALVIVRDYRDDDEKAAARARRRQASAHAAESTAVAPAATTEPTTESATVEGVETPTADEVASEAVTITSPLVGRAVPISQIPDPVFSTGVVGDGIAVEPANNTVVCPADATIVTAPDSGHAFGLKLDSGVELLI